MGTNIYRPHLSSTLRLLVVSGLTALFLLMFFTNRASAHSSIALANSPTITSVNAGFQTRYRDGDWIPVQVSLNNTSSDFNGKISINIAPPFSGVTSSTPLSTYQTPISLPTSSQKQVTVYVPLYTGSQGASQSISVDLLDNNGHKITTLNAPLNSLRSSEYLVGILSDQSSGFGNISTASLPGQGPQVVLQPLNAASLPSLSAILKNFDFIVLDNFTTSSLNQDQLTALQTWVSQGGTLIIAGGPEWQRSLNPLPASLLPVTLTGTDTLPPGTHLLPIGGPNRDAPNASDSSSDTLQASVPISVAAPKPGSATLLSSGNTPLIVEANHGQGQVFYLAYDPMLEPLVGWSHTSNLWGGLLLRALGDQLFVSNTTVNSSFGSSFGSFFSKGSYGMEGLLQALFPTISPPTWLILLLLLSYILILGPIRLLIVRQFKSRDWSWRIVLSTILVFSLLSYGLALQQKGTSIVSSSLSLIQLGQPDATGSDAHTTTYVGVFVPSQGDFQVHIPGFTLVQPSTQSYAYRPQNSQAQQTTITSSQDGINANLQGVDIWTLRTLISTRDNHTQGGIVSHLSFKNGGLSGSVTNTLPYSLKDAYVLMGSDFVPLGDLAAGVTKQVSLPLNSSFNLTSVNTTPTTIADQIATSHGLTPRYNPYYNNGQPLSEIQLHMVMLQTLSGEIMGFPCGSGFCYQSAPMNNFAGLGISKGMLFNGSNPKQPGNQDPLTIPDSPATFIAWTAPQSDPSNKITINGSTTPGTQEAFVQAPLPVSFTGSVSLPPSLLNSNLVDAQSQNSSNIQEPYSGIYSMTTGSMTFEFSLPNTLSLHDSSFSFTDSSALPRATGPLGTNPTSDVNHLHVYLYNWQTHTWDSYSFNQFKFSVPNSQPYIGPGGRVLLQLANQDNTLGATVFDRPALQIQGTVSQ